MQAIIMYMWICMRHWCCELNSQGLKNVWWWFCLKWTRACYTYRSEVTDRKKRGGGGRGQDFSGSTSPTSPWPAPEVHSRPDRSHRNYSPAPAGNCSSPFPAGPSHWTLWCTGRRERGGSRPAHMCLAAGLSSHGSDNRDRRAEVPHSRLLLVTPRESRRRKRSKGGC